MSFFRIELNPPADVFPADKRPPMTLPVMYQNESVGLAVLTADHYEFMVDDRIGVGLEFSELQAVIVFGQQGRGWSKKYESGDDVQCIMIEPAESGGVNPNAGAEDRGQPGSNAI